MAKFEQGNKAGKGGRREGAGRKTNEERAFQSALREAIAREANRHATAIARKYIQRAKAGKAELRHLVDKVLENAKQTVEHKGGIEVRRITVRTIDPDDGHGKK